MVFRLVWSSTHRSGCNPINVEFISLYQRNLVKHFPSGRKFLLYNTAWGFWRASDPNDSLNKDIKRFLSPARKRQKNTTFKQRLWSISSDRQQTKNGVSSIIVKMNCHQNWNKPVYNQCTSWKSLHFPNHHLSLSQNLLLTSLDPIRCRRLSTISIFGLV